MAENKKANGLILGPDDSLPTSEATVLGFQQVLALDAYVGPLLIASMLELNATQTSSFLQAACLACDFGTIIQTAIFMKMPLSQGPSFVPANAIVGIYFANGGNNGGMSVILTSCVVGEGITCLVSVLIGSVHMTGYSTNAGIVSITGVASRKVFVAAGVWFMRLGLFSKLAALLASIPSPVIGGIGAVVLVIIMLNGLNTISDLKTAGNQSYIIGIPISVTMALLPDQFKEAAPKMLQYLIGSPIAVAAITAIVLNLILNRKSKTATQAEAA